MRRILHGPPALGVAGLLAVVAIGMPATPCRADGFVETFSDDPVAAGRFVLEDGPATAGRFVHDLPGGTMKAHYDTGLPTARLVHPLGRTLTQVDAFVCRAALTINSAGFFADTSHIAQIAFGLMNTQTTGVDRVYGTQGGAYDLVSFDWFPNVTFFGGPSMGPTIINSDVGQGFSAAINFTFGPETATDPQDAGIVKDVPLVAELRYDPALHRLILRVFRDGTPMSINAVGKYYWSGGSDHDATTIVTDLTGAGFTVDALAILLWRDYSSSTSSVIADVIYDQMEVCWSSFGDFDGDCDVDQDDYALFASCTSGPGVAFGTGCGLRDGDGDGDVDQADFGKFQVMLTGPR